MPWVEDDSPPQKGWVTDEAPGQDASDKRRGQKGIMRSIDAGVRGAADMLTFGFADEMAGYGNALPELVNGVDAFQRKASENIAAERAIDEADKAQRGVARGVGQGAGVVGSLATGAVVNAGRLLPNALRAGGGFAGNVARGAVAGSTYGGLAGAGNADGSVAERASSAVPSALGGAAVGALAVPVVGAIGAGVNALSRRGAPMIERAAHALRPRTNVVEATERGNALRTAGADPSFASATDEGGRGFIRAAASRMTPGRQVVQQRANVARVNLPGRVNRQAAQISDDVRTPDQIRDDLRTRRSNLATEEYATPYAEPVQIDMGMARGLEGAPGQAAMNRARRAAEAHNDDAQIAEIDRLLTGDFFTPVSAGTIDRVRRAMGERAEVALGPNSRARDIGAGLTRREGMIDGGLDAVPGLSEARGTYRNLSRQIEAADVGEGYLTRGSTDEFVAAAPSPGEIGNTEARATARRATERRAGESPANALSTAETIAIAPEQMARTRGIMPEVEAQALERGMGAEVQVYRDLQDVAPRTGPQTQNRTADQETVGAIVDGVRTFAGGPRAWMEWAGNRLKTAGLSDADAEAVATIATDPTQLTALLERVARQPDGQRWVRVIQETLTQGEGRNIGEGLAPKPAIEVTAPAFPGAVGRAY